MEVQEGPMIDASSDVYVEADKEEGGAVGVYRPQKSPVVDISTNVCYPRES